MNEPGPSILLAKLELSDEAAAQVLEFLYELVTGFENAYFEQLQRYYATDEPSANTLPPLQPTDSGEDPEFLLRTRRRAANPLSQDPPLR